MAFRRRFFPRRGRSFGFRRRPAFSGASQKWIGYHQLVESGSVVRDPLFPNETSFLPAFVPLVGVTDYADSDPTIFTSEQAGEKSLVKRSIGQFHLWIPNLGDSESQYIFALEAWWYFAAMSRDDVLNGADLLVADPTSGAMDTFDLGLQNALPLWRRPVKKFGTDMSFHNVRVGQTVTQTDYDGQQIVSRNWDFAPRAPLRVPMEWYLVFGATVYWIAPTVAPLQTLLCFVTARTLIAD